MESLREGAPYVLLGLVAGTIGGMFGIGGGLVIVPALILFYGFGLKEATGTSLLAQLLPVGLLGVLVYWRRNEIRIDSGLWIAGGLFLGALLGAQLTGLIPAKPMRQLYGVFLLAVGAYFLLHPGAVKERVRPPEKAAQGHVAAIDPGGESRSRPD
jgi:uncharacterized membrane protein YfcA